MFAPVVKTTKTSTNGPKWISLFNGKDLNDWFVKIQHHEVGDNFGNTFRIEDSMIRVKYDQYGDFNDQFGHLYYKVPFSYYHLKLEYRFVGELQKVRLDYTLRNSGVMYHSQDPRTMPKEQGLPISIEMQFLGGLGDGKTKKHRQYVLSRHTYRVPGQTGYPPLYQFHFQNL